MNSRVILSRKNGCPEVANLSTYVLNNFGTPGGRVTKDEVAKLRKAAPAAAGAEH